MVVQPVGFRRYALLGAAIFLYTLVVSVLIQLVLLPRVFPAWHAGNGLITGGDMPYYHQLALDLAQDIELRGWSVWTLSPAGQAPAGVAGALYALVAPKPWTMIPLYALLHALAGVLLARILLYFDPRLMVAILGALPLVLFPSAATWYSQLGKDGFSIAGYLSIVLGWITLAQFRIEPRIRRIVYGVLLLLAGVGLVWIVRPYAVEILLVLSVPAAFLLTIELLRRVAQSGFPWKRAVLAAVATSLTIVAILPLAWGGYEPELPAGVHVDPDTSLSSEAAGSEVTFEWSRTAWLPNPLDDRINSIAVARKRFTTLFPDAGSNIDIDISFHQASDVVGYVPRATALAFLYPVPVQWLQEGSIPQNTLMRRIAGLEMAGVYLALAMLPYAIWRWRGRLETWLVLLFSVGMLIALALVVANLGTLYRMRYPYIMSIVGLSVAGVTALLVDRRARPTETKLGIAQVY